MDRPINSFIYRKNSKYGHRFYYVNLLSEKVQELSSEVSGFIHGDDEVTLTNIEELPNQKFRVLPISTFALLVDDQPINAEFLTVDQLIDYSYKAAQKTLERQKLSQNF